MDRFSTRDRIGSRAGGAALVVALAALLAGGACGSPGAGAAGGDGAADGATGATASAPSATRVLDEAIERMGGLAALRGIERVRYDMITWWSRLNYAGGPYDGAGSYEEHTDVRDYTIDAWRNTREFPNGRTIVDLVRGDVAVRDFGNGFQPLNVAYVDERRELFAYTPDRLVLALRDAADLRALSDTSLAGAPHARVRGTVDRFEMTLHLRRGDALPTMASFRAAHPNDFGLVPWGEMDVAVWYSGWQSLPGGVSLPTHWSIERIGQLYKRITARRVTLNPELAADSFAVTADLADAYRQTATRPMHDIPLDSARVAGDFVTFGAFGAPVGALRVGDGWLLLETGQARLSVERALGWLADHAPGAPIGAVVTTTIGNGGVPALTEREIPVLAAPGVVPHLRTIVRNAPRSDGVTEFDVETVAAGRWIASAGDSVYLEPIDLPDTPGALLVYSPRLSWIYVHDALRPLDHAILRGRIARRGWTVAELGNGRGLRQPFDATGKGGAGAP